MEDSKVHFEVWFGGDTKRHRKADSEADAVAIADEFAAEGQIGIEVIKVTVTRKQVNRTPKPAGQ